MDLTKRQKRFLLAAYRQTDLGDWNEVYDRDKAMFFINDIGEMIGIPSEEALDIARLLERDYDFLNRSGAHSGLRESVAIETPDRAVAMLTDRGREAARQLGEDKRSQRRAIILSVLKWFWVTAMSVALPVTVALLNRRIERLEKRPIPATVSATAPARP